MLVTKQKRNPRKARQHAAWITFNGDLVSHECRVMDVSATGAKLRADIDMAAGTKFRLSTIPRALVNQRCEVVWRRGRIIGAKFVG
jgi:hypothetical protein